MGAPVVEQINYEPLLPQMPAEDVVGWAYQCGKFQSAYLIYRADWEYVPLEERSKPAVRVVCSACQQSFLADKASTGGCNPRYAAAPFGWWNGDTAIISGQATVCPYCGRPAIAVHVGNMNTRGEQVDDAWVSVLSRLSVAGKQDRLVLMDWCIRRCINKQGETRHEIWPYTAWVVEEKKIVRLMGYMKTIGGAISLFGRWEQRKTFSDVFGKSDLLMPWDKSLLEGTTAENCKLDLYLEAGGKHLVGYLALWRRRPAVENLLVQGCGRLVADWIGKENGRYGYRGGIPKLEQVNWKEKRPAQMLGLNKEEFRFLRRMNWTAADLSRYRLAQDHGVEIHLPMDLELLWSMEEYNLARILGEAPKADFWRIVRYLKRQKEGWSTLRDYWRMAEEDGRDLSDNLVRWPRNLTASHQRQIEDRRALQSKQEAERRAREKAERSALFQKRLAELEPLSWAVDGLLIRPCANEDELIQEGRELHHCVASYAQSHASGTTAILFIRKADAPDRPYFTLEFDEKRQIVRQNRGLRNCERTEEVRNFEAAWLKWVKSKARKKGAA